MKLLNDLMLVLMILIPMSAFMYSGYTDYEWHKHNHYEYIDFHTGTRNMAKHCIETRKEIRCDKNKAVAYIIVKDGE